MRQRHFVPGWVTYQLNGCRFGYRDMHYVLFQKLVVKIERERVTGAGIDLVDSNRTFMPSSRLALSGLGHFFTGQIPSPVR